MQVVLGPMQGVLDPLMRQLLTEINDYDYCVTEFVRVVDQRLPKRVFYRLCPELFHHSCTASGVPVKVQLLGQDPNWMAENAVFASELGAKGVDLNFGCPAKTVNKSKGGAVLLQQPELIYQIVKACRQALPAHISLSAKIRLGWEDPNDCFEIVDAIHQAQADELTIHARTKMGGYKASEIQWHYINELRQRTNIPIVANGEVWNYQDGQECLSTTGVQALMLCRGALNVPNLGNVVKYNQAMMSWQEVIHLLIRYTQSDVAEDKGLYFPNRIKQWFCYLRQAYPQATALFQQLRSHQNRDDLVGSLLHYQAQHS